jgi:endo-1,4-beta-D-glucanase Y/4-amino-4-deoxy-L-arabinose transferase-like glycosyltransferase
MTQENTIVRLVKNSLAYFQLHIGVVLLVVSLLVAGGLHGFNMLYYPYFESDEGTYLSQAASVAQDGQLAPYTYWYDHPPLGWLTIAAVTTLWGGDWNLFGSPLYTARFVMFLLHLIQVALLYFIVTRVTRSPWLGFTATLLFAVTPLATYFQRRILLDNLMVTWLMLSIAILYVREIKMRHVIMSGVFFGCAVLTKITAVMFGPAFLYLLIAANWNIHRGFRTLGWLITSIGIFSTWILYSIIKTEFLPSPTGEKVSLLGGILFQLTRESGTHFWEQGSSIRTNMESWLVLDEMALYMVVAGVIAAIVLTVFEKRYRFFGIATILYVLFLIRGGIVFNFYILPLLPFIAISIVASMELVYRTVPAKFTGKKLISTLFLVLFIGSFIAFFIPGIHRYLTVDETTNQMEALRWIKNNLPEDAFILMDVYGMTELRDPNFVNEKIFRNADWYFKVSKDPAIRFEKYRDDWRNFDYVLISHEMLYQASLHQLPVADEAIRNSQPIMRWDENSTSFIDVQRFISTNGDWAALHQVNNSTKTQLLYAWNHYRDTYIHSYGQVVDPQTELTTSEGQAYAMLRAALMNDKDAFKGIWLWTQHHLQHRLDDTLLSWKWSDGKQLDGANATDGDLDAAVALIFASKIFNNEEYLDDAQELIDDIWRQTVVSIRGTQYLLPAERSLVSRGDYYLLNPSYFSPAYYRLFAEVDTTRAADWLKLADDTYTVLERLQAQNNGNAVLPPNWILVHRRTGALQSAAPYITAGASDRFGYDAFRTIWRVALDVEWYDTPRGRVYLRKIGPTFEQEWRTRQAFGDLYSTTGARVRADENLAISAGILSGLGFSSDAALSSQIYNDLFVERMTILEEEEYAYWDDPENYYDANWVWFGLALFNGNMQNLWDFYN